MHSGRRKNDAETETAARVIAAAAFRCSSLLAARPTRVLLTRSRARLHCVFPVKRQTYPACIQATAAVASARTASCVESENNASQ